VAYYVGPRPSMQIVPSSRWRDWMNATANRNANRCLPLLAGNEFGWVLLNNRRVTVEWSGGDMQDDLRVEYDGPPPTDGQAQSGFGYGIVTFLIPYLFRTPAGWDLMVRGPTNEPKDGVAALDAVVETDWSLSPFTMSWKLTRPGTVVFEAGEPICMVIPQRRYDLESFAPEVRSAMDDEEVARGWSAATKSRQELQRRKFLASYSKSFRESLGEWEGLYFRGRLPNGDEVPEHITKRRLKRFGQDDPPDAADS
jgi:Family of unknown function (DUF6065)